ncbi:MAG TPA: DUF4148 domain-containing protein [Paraburkholderia sp.]|jgi:hypothetical protein
MKTLIYLTLAVSAMASPVLSFAQTVNVPLTRAEVRADLVRVEQAGYSPSTGDDVTYPADIQAAEAKIAAQHGTQAAAANNSTTASAMAADSVGAATSGSSESGSRKPTHNKPANQCVGPVDFCVPYFGS